MSDQKHLSGNHKGLPLQFNQNCICIILIFLIYSFPLFSAEPQWHPAQKIGISGIGWVEKDHPFNRLPLRVNKTVTKSLWNLSRQTAGLHLHFKTNSPTLSFRWSLTSGKLEMGHMPSTGVSGLDLYKKSANGSWHFIKNGWPVRKENNTSSASTDLRDGQQGEFILYLPLYNGIEKLELGIKPGSKIEKVTRKNKPLIIYGTSITQGACASRPGMAWTSILGREIDREIINLGFSGNGKMEQSVTNLISELDPEIFIIDCLWNMRRMKKEEVQNRVKKTVQTIRKKHPETPIVFIGQTLFDPVAHPTKLSTWQSEAFKQLQKQGEKNLHLIPAKALLGNDLEGTVDGIHPNDLGMQRHAKAVAIYLKSNLNIR